LEYLSLTWLLRPPLMACFARVFQERDSGLCFPVACFLFAGGLAGGFLKPVGGFFLHRVSAGDVPLTSLLFLASGDRLKLFLAG